MGIRRTLLAVAGGAAVAALLAAFAVLLVRGQSESGRQLEDRFALRGALAAKFGSSFVTSLVKDERRRAIDRLSGPVDDSAVRAVGRSLDFQASVLLDGNGRLLAAWRAGPKLVGTRLSDRYPHLAAAVHGRVGVSNLVRSAVKGLPVVAFAVPFRTSSGRRVFSGAFSIEHTPLGAYLRTASPIKGARVYLIDAHDAVIASTVHGGGALGVVDRRLDRAAGRARRGTYKDHGARRFFAITPVRGTPWHVISVVPEAGLLAPISGDAQLFPWLVFGAFALASCVALLLLFRTSTQRRLLTEANAALQARNEELRELDRLKDEFVALVSHELRTPLTSIVGYVRVLLRNRAEPLQEQQRELLQVVDRNASRLVALVGDLLFTGKVDAGKLTLEPTTFALAELARQSVESALPVAGEREVELVFENGGDVEVEADRPRIAQLIDNLVSNAVKFTPAGGRVTVRVEAGDDDALLTVEDSGIGIPEAELERLFERFFRASTATSREIPGSGLGLSVAKTIAELHGGSLELRSREGEGTTVVARLPRGSAGTRELAA